MVIDRARWRVFRLAAAAAVREYSRSREAQRATAPQAPPTLDQLKPEPHDDYADLVQAIRRFGGEHYDLPPVGPSSEALARWDAVGWLDAYAPFDRIMFTADGEDLAEELVEPWLACMAPALEHYGLPLTVQTLQASQPCERLTDMHGYIVMINGVRCQVWERAEWDEDCNPYWNPWLAATLRPLAVINTLLDAAGCTVRAHVMNAGGNDAVVVLVDPHIVEAMRDSGNYPRPAIPSAIPSRAVRTLS